MNITNHHVSNSGDRKLCKKFFFFFLLKLCKKFFFFYLHKIGFGKFFKIRLSYFLFFFAVMWWGWKSTREREGWTWGKRGSRRMQHKYPTLVFISPSVSTVSVYIYVALSIIKMIFWALRTWMEHFLNLNALNNTRKYICNTSVINTVVKVIHHKYTN